LVAEECDRESLNQIMRDLTRTFPNHEYFKDGSEGLKRLRNVLIAFANYDKQVGK
jgi:outer membrane protein assembly factor BamD (BamD/ComL family)